MTAFKLEPTSARRTPPSYRVMTRDGTTNAAIANGTTECILGHHVCIDYHALEHFYLKALEFEHIDLLLLAGVVMFVDRKCHRSQTFGWAREFDITMQVHDPDRWMAQAVRSKLESALCFLTGDTWHFRFTRRTVDEVGHRHLPLVPRSAIRPIVLPFSGGLDSFAALRMVADDPDVLPVVVTARHGGGRWRKLRGGMQTVGADCELRTISGVEVPIRLRIGEHPERSCRARMFEFFSVAAVTAFLADTSDIVVPEAGQGSLAVNVIPSAYQSPPRGTHPGFSRRFASFLHALLGISFRFDHRFLWQTKGETLTQLRERGLASGWQTARSCAQKLYRRPNGAGVRSHCGVCANCLLRRVSLMAADLDSETEIEPYMWHDLSAPTIKESLHPRFKHLVTRVSDEKSATSAVHLYQDVAQASLLPDVHLSLQQTAYEAASALSITPPLALEKLRTLLDHHRREWTMFLSQLPSRSWVVQRAGDG